MTDWINAWHVTPDPDEPVIVALYHHDGRFHAYAICQWDEERCEWRDDMGNDWTRVLRPGVSAGLLWCSFQSAPEAVNVACLSGSHP